MKREIHLYEKDLIAGRQSRPRDLSSYRISSRALQRAERVFIHMRGSPVWIAKDHNGPQECWA